MHRHTEVQNLKQTLWNQSGFWESCLFVVFSALGMTREQLRANTEELGSHTLVVISSFSNQCCTQHVHACTCTHMCSCS